MSIMTLAHFLDPNGVAPSPEQQEAGVGEVCIANISPAERQKRMRFGILTFIVTLVILGILIALHANPLWRLPLLFLFWSSASGYFQAKDKT
jgi:hypothetical protein